MAPWDNLESLSWDEIQSILCSQSPKATYSANDALVSFVEFCEALPHKMESIRTLSLSHGAFSTAFRHVGRRGLSALVRIVMAGYLDQLRKLDLSGHDNLARGLVEEFGGFFKSGHWNQLQELHFRACRITTRQVKLLAQYAAAGHLKELVSLNLNDNFIDDEGCGVLAESFAAGHFSNVVSLNLGGNRFGDKGATALLKAFASGQCSKIVSLDLSRNNIGDGGATALARAFESESLSDLQGLNLRNCGIEKAGVESLASSLASGSCTKLKSLELSGNNLGEAGAMALCTSFESGNLSDLQTLGLRRTELCDGGAAAVARSLQSGYLSKLVCLDLAKNKIGLAGANSLAKAIESGHLSNMGILALSGNELQDEGVARIVDSFGDGNLREMESLHLSSTGMGMEGAIRLTQWFQSGGAKILRYLNLSENKIGDVGVEALATSFQSGNLRKLQRLYLSDVKIGRRGAEALALSFESDSVQLNELKTLDLSHNRLVDEGDGEHPTNHASTSDHRVESLPHGDDDGRRKATALMRSFKSDSWRNLETLNLSGTGVDDVGVEALAEAIAEGFVSTLKHLDLSGIAVTHKAMVTLLRAYGKGEWQRCDVESSTLRLTRIMSLPPSLGHKSGESVTSSILCLPSLWRSGFVDPVDLDEWGAAHIQILASAISRQLQVLHVPVFGNKAAFALANSIRDGEWKKLRALINKNASDIHLSKESWEELMDAFRSPHVSKVEYIRLQNLGRSFAHADTRGPTVGEVDNIDEMARNNPHELVEEIVCAVKGGTLRSLKVFLLFEKSFDVSRISETAKQALVNCYRKNPYLVVRICDEELESEQGLMGDIGVLRRSNEERVARLRELESEPDVPGKHGKVFLCGNPGVGKTTLRIALTGERSAGTSTGFQSFTPSRVGRKLRMHCLTGCMKGKSQRDSALSPTRGIEVSDIEGGGSSTTEPLVLALWDLAGQHEYQVLHSAFLPDIALADGQATFFVLVCSTDIDQNLSFDSVLYWLRFLSSNSVEDVQDGERRRRVFLVLNCFHGDLSDHNEELWRFSLGQWRSMFNLFLNLHEDLFILNATDANEVNTLKEKLLDEASRMLQKRRMPNICSRIQESCKEWIKRSTSRHQGREGYYPVLTWNEFSSQIGENCIFSPAKLNAAAQYLHEAGHLILFKVEAEASTSARQEGADRILLIVDPTWFCQNVVGHLLLPECLVTSKDLLQKSKMFRHTDLENGPLPISIFQKGYFLVPKEKLQDVVMLMSRLGLCYQLETRSEGVFIPALIDKNDAPGWYSDWNTRFDQQTWVMGYSLKVKDPKTLLPVTVLRRLQVDLAQEEYFGRRPDSCYVARKFCIAFNCERLMILIEYPFDSATNTSIGKEDRIDVLVKPMDSDPSHHASRRVEQTNVAHKIVHRIISITRDCCPGVELQRRIVKPWAVRSGLVTFEDRDIETSVEDAKRRVVKRVESRSGSGMMDWEEPVVSAEELLPEEDLDEYKHLILGKYSRTEGAVKKLGLTAFNRQQVIEQTPQNPDSVIIWKAVKDLKEKLDALSRDVNEMRDDVKEIKGDIHKIAAAQESINHQLLSLERLSLGDKERLRSVPRFVYLKQTGADSKWRINLIKLRETFSKAMTLHFLCESPRRGLHEVEAESQKGVQFEMFRDWLQKLLPVLDWTLRVTFVALKIAGNVVLPGLGVALSDIPPATLSRAIQMASGIPDLWKHISDTFEVGSAAHPVDFYDHSLADSLEEDSYSSGNDRLRLDSLRYFELRGEARAAVREIYNNLDDMQKREKVGLTRVCLDDDRDRYQVVWICDECLKVYGGKAHELQDPI